MTKHAPPTDARSDERYPDRETVICTYRVKEGKDSEMLALMSRHWPTLRKLGLVTPEEPLVFAGCDDSGKTFLVEIFSWVDHEAAGRAHSDPAVMAIWGAMDPLVEERLGRPKWEFPHVKPVALELASRTSSP